MKVARGEREWERESVMNNRQTDRQKEKTARERKENWTFKKEACLFSFLFSQFLCYIFELSELLVWCRHSNLLQELGDFPELLKNTVQWQCGVHMSSANYCGFALVAHTQQPLQDFFRQCVTVFFFCFFYYRAFPSHLCSSSTLSSITNEFSFKACLEFKKKTLNTIWKNQTSSHGSSRKTRERIQVLLSKKKRKKKQVGRRIHFLSSRFPILIQKQK